MDAETSSEVPTFAEETASVMRKELQSWWEIPSIAQYISLFREAFNLPEIEFEELENGLIEDCINGPNEWLQNLLIAFLRSIMAGRVTAINFDLHLKRLFKKKWSESIFGDKENPFAEEKSFHELNLRSKVEVIYCFCLFRLDNNDIGEAMKSMDADALRVQRLGIDDGGNTYWYFYGTRLYKEEPLEEKKTWNEEWDEQKRQSLNKKRGRGRPPKKKIMEKAVEEEPSIDDRYMNVSGKSRWSVVCDTFEEWVNLTEGFKSSKSKTEKSLFLILQENFLPTLSKIYEEKERKLQEKVKELLPAREKIVTRRETRRLRGDTGRDINYALLNGYDSEDENKYNNEDFKSYEVKSRAERLEERNRKVEDAENVQYIGTNKRAKYNDESTSPQNSTSSENSENVELDLMSQMIKLLTSVKLHKDAWPFLYPVNEEDAPGYYEIIKDPIDLSTIENRLYKGDYETVGDLDEDFSKMVSNCELYNGEKHAYSRMAQTLRKLFRKEVANLLEMLETVSSSNGEFEESNDSQYHSSSNSNASSPPREYSVVESKEHSRVKGKKKKRKHTNMEALDMMAQASSIAVQPNITNSPSSSQKKHPVPQETRPAAYHVPSTNMPSNASSSSSSPSTNKVSVPVTSSSFITFNPSPQGATRNKPVIVRTKAYTVDKRSSPSENVASTSLNTLSNKSSSNTLQQTNVNESYSPKTVPVVISRSPSNQGDLRIQNNPVTMQSNVCLPNGLPIVQQVLLPAGSQLPNTGQQYVITSPQNTFRILGKDQGVSLQNNVGQLNQSFMKVVPQIIAPGQVMQVSKDAMQSFQFQTLSPNNTQTFTQIAQNPQFVSLPYVVSNQNSMTNTTSQPTMSYQTFTMPSRPMHIGGQGNS